MRTLLSHWKFHKAGQGCFYTGLINAHNQNQFSFVFDCGSTKGSAILREEIQDYQAKLKKAGTQTIDLLVLSHYDADHVNQLPLLLKDLHCKVAVLPYLSNWQRLLVYAAHVPNDATDETDYLRYLIDPATYLTERNVSRIIFIDGNDEQNGGLNQPAKVPGNPPRFAANRESLDQTADHILSPDLNVSVRLKPGGDFNDPEKMMMLQHHPAVEFALANGSITAGEYWEFFFHEKAQPSSAVNAFRRAIVNHFKITPDGDFLQHDQLISLIQNRKLRKKLKALHTFISAIRTHPVWLFCTAP